MDEATMLAFIAAPIFARRTGPESNRIALALEEAQKLQAAASDLLEAQSLNEPEEVSGDQGAVSGAAVEREAEADGDDLSDLLGE